MPFRELVLDRLHQDFGEPLQETEKFACWNLPHGQDLLAEKDCPPTQGVLWIPWDPSDFHLEFAELYPATRRRRECICPEACPSLAQGETALRIPVCQEHELWEAICEIRARFKIDPAWRSIRQHS
jgi:hypothetical protein